MARDSDGERPTQHVRERPRTTRARATLAGVATVDNPPAMSTDVPGAAVASTTALAATRPHPQNPAARRTRHRVPESRLRRLVTATAVLVVLAVLITTALALDGARERSELIVAESDELLGIGATATPVPNTDRLRVVVADVDLGARIGSDESRLGNEHGLREDLDGITDALEHFDADILVLFDVAESIPQRDRPMVRRIAADTGLRFMLQTRHWSKRRAWWPTPTPVGPVDAAHVVYARWPIESNGGAVRAPRDFGLAHRLWGPSSSWMSGRIAMTPSRLVDVVVEAGLPAPRVESEALQLRACLGPCESDDDATTLTGDDGHVELSFGPGFRVLRAVTHGRLHGTLVHAIVYAEVAIEATAPTTPPPPVPE